MRYLICQKYLQNIKILILNVVQSFFIFSSYYFIWLNIVSAVWYHLIF